MFAHLGNRSSGKHIPSLEGVPTPSAVISLVLTEDFGSLYAASSVSNNLQQNYVRRWEKARARRRLTQLCPEKSSPLKGSETASRNGSQQMIRCAFRILLFCSALISSTVHSCRRESLLSRHAYLCFTPFGREQYPPPYKSHHGHSPVLARCSTEDPGRAQGK